MTAIKPLRWANSQLHSQTRLLAAGICLSLPLAAIGCQSATHGRPAAPEPAPQHLPKFDDGFWRAWSDGKAELSGYALTFPRYGELRRGTAVAIFVTETFSDTLRVKADPGKHPAEDTYPVLKLNLVRDFQTGVYDYNTMTSAFVALGRRGAQAVGHPTKVSYSSQEWCGHVYHQLLFDAQHIRETSHSYFDGEADIDRRLPRPPQLFAEDTLLLWARGMAWPVLQRGQVLRVPYLPSLQHARLAHVPLTIAEVTLSRAAQPSTITVPAGTFEVDVYTARVQGGDAHTVYAETKPPHRILRWTSSSGEEAELLASDRLAYWQQQANADASILRKIGLEPPPPPPPPAQP